jgi:hypothetical protein
LEGENYIQNSGVCDVYIQNSEKICKELTGAISQFWWGDDINDNKMHWFAQWKLCIPKRRGDFCFRILILSI